MKCSSADALAEDLQRYLDDRPIHAQPQTTFRRLSKFTRRHRIGVIATATVLLALTTGLVVALMGLRRAIAAQSATDQARAQAEALLMRLRDNLQPAFADLGGLNMLRTSTEAALQYYESLPPELRDTKTEERHATALESLIRVRKTQGDRRGLEEMWRAALDLRRKIAAANPTDGDAAAELLKNEYSTDFSRMAVLSDSTAQKDERTRKEILHQWRLLRDRFPENPRVKVRLATELLQFSLFANEPWLGMYRPKDAVAAAAEGQLLIDELSSSHSGYAGLRDLAWLSANVRATIHRSAGEDKEATEIYEQLVADVNLSLQNSPGNLGLRSRLAGNLSAQANAVAKLSLQRAAALSRQAREHYSLLTRLDPTNRYYARRLADSYINECYYLAWGDCAIEPARKAFREWDAASESFSETEPSIRWQRCWRSLYLAGLAARAGDVDDARAQIAEARTRFDFYQNHLPDNPHERQQAQILYLTQLAWPLHLLHDWSGLEDVTRRCLQLTDTALLAQPQDADLKIHRSMSLTMLGHAWLRQARIDEAVAALQQAIAGYRETPLPPTLLQAEFMHILATESLAEALAHRGNLPEARKLFESAIQARENQMGADRKNWGQREQIATTLIQLSGTYSNADLGERTVRAQLLDRAAAILESPDADGRITMDGKAAKARLATLREEVD